MKILRWLQHLLVPHNGNEYTPHILRKVSVLTLAGIGGFIFLSSLASTFILHKTNQGALVVASVLVDLTNKDREASNELALARNPTLDQAAYLKAQDMVARGYFAHTSPQGLTPWYWFDKAGYFFVYAGENLAINFSESADVEQAWLNSPLHRANILNGRFSEIGLATIDGEYNGKPTTFVVQMFGTPALAKTAATIKTPPEKAVPSTKIAPVAEADTNVKGESVEKSDELETVASTDNFVAVKNTAAVEDVSKNKPVSVPAYSSWYDRFLFSVSTYGALLYKILMAAVILSLLLMLTIEIKKHHIRHIAYGFGALAVLGSLSYIHNALFVYRLIF